jgi:hypothetical protein
MTSVALTERLKASIDVWQRVLGAPANFASALFQRWEPRCLRVTVTVD